MLGGFSSKNGPPSFAFPSSRPAPLTTKDWKDTLMEVKRLYLQRQYKQCAARCVELLNKAKPTVHPICKSFLSFYAAICYEFLGQAAHPYSVHKLTLLNSALEHFIQCGDALPAPITLPRLSKTDDDPSCPSSPTSPATPITVDECLALFQLPNQMSPQRDSVIAGISRLIDASLQQIDDPFLDSDEDDIEELLKLAMMTTSTSEGQITTTTNSPTLPITTKLTRDSVKRRSLLPSPLSINKTIDDNASDTTVVPSKPASGNGNQTLSSSRVHPPRLPLKIIPTANLNAGDERSSPSSSSFSCFSSPISTIQPLSINRPRFETPPTSPLSDGLGKGTPSIALENLTPVHAARIVRSNRGIAFLREQITTSIQEIQTHIRRVQELQAIRRARKMQRAASFWSFDPVTDSENSEMGLGPESTIDEFGNLILKETKEQRLVRLRSEKWETVGLRSPRSTWKGARYYQDFCAMVMNEINMDS
ncbi:uncharacterized protein N7483_008509 [Penicillium malachiteum]|uniref:uncharacterized protein n=1 Tax=Penicillium malachiteum TaxID=1324776 RepID=UPI002548020B|nr:uncharacterized protein N7483_008509 [Penicillium malachiteum]KAJ5720575.1 hypothetical protein N7483_008509 [Penicillium malachiteum]